MVEPDILLSAPCEQRSTGRTLPPSAAGLVSTGDAHSVLYFLPYPPTTVCVRRLASLPPSRWLHGPPDMSSCLYHFLSDLRFSQWPPTALAAARGRGWGNTIRQILAIRPLSCPMCGFPLEGASWGKRFPPGAPQGHAGGLCWAGIPLQARQGTGRHSGCAVSLVLLRPLIFCASALTVLRIGIKGDNGEFAETRLLWVGRGPVLYLAGWVRTADIGGISQRRGFRVMV